MSTSYVSKLTLIICQGVNGWFVCMYVFTYVYVYVYVCNAFTVYTEILERSAPFFLWALSGLLASMSLHLGSVVQKSCVGVRALRTVLFVYHTSHHILFAQNNS